MALSPSARPPRLMVEQLDEAEERSRERQLQLRQLHGRQAGPSAPPPGAAPGPDAGARARTALGRSRGSSRGMPRWPRTPGPPGAAGPGGRRGGSPLGASGRPGRTPGSRGRPRAPPLRPGTTGSPATRGGGGRPWTTQGGRAGEGGPGPGLKSTFGWQTYGHRVSSPSYSFPRTDPEHAERRYLSAKHASHQFNLASSPGPVYKYNQLFGTGFHSDFSASTTGRMFPRPQVEERDIALQLASAPGPGTYPLPSGFDLHSAAGPLPRFRKSFSRTDRGDREKVYVSRHHEKHFFGSNSPGPAIVAQDSFRSIGKQSRSTAKTAPAWGFARAARFAYLSKPKPSPHRKPKPVFPGPGSYDI